jgi:hypothetical protein
MSNVIQHPSSRRNAEQRRAEEAKRRAKLVKEGGAALKTLIGWRRYIPMEDRIRLAENMENIFLDYDIKIADLDWRKEYVSIENLRLDVHRMRLPADGPDGRRLVATSNKWVGLLNLVYGDVQGKDEGVSLEFLADKLTRGSRFHPAKKSRTKSEKLFYLLSAWANEIDEKHGVVGTYRKIAAARVEYLRLNLKGMGEINDWYEEKPACLSHTVADDPDLSIRQNAPDFHAKLENLTAKYGEYYEALLSGDPNPSIQEFPHVFYTKLEYLSDEDWDYLAAELPNDDWKAIYRRKRGEIDDWKKQFVESTTLVNAYEQAALGDSLAFLPHWFVGFHADKLAESTEDDNWMDERFSNHGTGDPLKYSNGVDWEWHCFYLVLYPNQAMTRLIPYLFYFGEEGTQFSPLGEVDLDDESKGSNVISCFKPEPKGVYSISRSLSDRIQESLEELFDSWDTTASQLKNHPYLKWKRERESSVDEQIQAMLERTGRGQKRRRKSSESEFQPPSPNTES